MKARKIKETELYLEAICSFSLDSTDLQFSESVDKRRTLASISIPFISYPVLLRTFSI